MLNEDLNAYVVDEEATSQIMDCSECGGIDLSADETNCVLIPLEAMKEIATATHLTHVEYICSFGHQPLKYNSMLF